MTSQADLTYMHSGLVWDGVTEYVNAFPPGVGGAWFVRLDDADTRRIREFAPIGSRPMDRIRERHDRDGWETIGYTGHFPGHDSPGQYFGYDGVIQEDPVNQFGYLTGFLAHGARFAHQLDDAMGHFSLTGASEEDRMATYHTLSSMLGSAWRRYQEWAEVDPLEIIHGGVFDGTLPLAPEPRRLSGDRPPDLWPVRYRNLRAAVPVPCQPAAISGGCIGAASSTCRTAARTHGRRRSST